MILRSLTVQSPPRGSIPSDCLCVLPQLLFSLKYCKLDETNHFIVVVGQHLCFALNGTIAPVCTSAEEHPIIVGGPRRTVSWPWVIISRAATNMMEMKDFIFTAGGCRNERDPSGP